MPEEARFCNKETIWAFGMKCSKEMKMQQKLVPGKDGISYATLQPKDYFGGRVMFAGEKAEGMLSNLW